MKIKGKKREALIEYLKGGDIDFLHPYTTYSEDVEGRVTQVISLKDARLLFRTMRELYTSQQVVAHT